MSGSSQEAFPMSGSAREAFPDVWEVHRNVREVLPHFREWSVRPPGCP